VSDFSDDTWEFTRGDTTTRRFTVRNRVTAAVVDITSWSAFRFTGKGRVTDTDLEAVVAETLSGGGIVKTTPASGILDVTIAAADTASLNLETYELYADLQGVDGSGNVWTVWKGKVVILPDASRTSP
jgi:hypothetical protein